MMSGTALGNLASSAGLSNLLCRGNACSVDRVIVGADRVVVGRVGVARRAAWEDEGVLRRWRMASNGRVDRVKSVPAQIPPFERMIRKVNYKKKLFVLDERTSETGGTYKNQSHRLTYSSPPRALVSQPTLLLLFLLLFLPVLRSVFDPKERFHLG